MGTPLFWSVKLSIAHGWGFSKIGGGVVTVFPDEKNLMFELF